MSVPNEGGVLPSIDDILSGLSGSKGESAPKEEPKSVSEDNSEKDTNISETDSLESAMQATEQVDENQDAVSPQDSQVSDVVKEEPKKREDPMSRRFAVLSRREREIQQRQREIEARENEIKRLQETTQQAITQKPKSALEALKQLGFSYQDATLEVLGQKEETPADPVQQRLDEMAERLKKIDEVEASVNKRWADLEAERAKALETQVRNSIVAVAGQDEDRYELLNTVGSEAFDLVYDVMSEHYAQHGALLTYQEGCDIVEQYYEERARAFSNTRKIGAKTAATPSAPKPTVASKPAQPAKASGPKTLTQRHSATVAAEPDVNTMSRDEAISFLAKKIPIVD